MTEQEAIKILTLNKKEQEKLPNLKKVYAVAITALEEIQQYRAMQSDVIKNNAELIEYRTIGTVEECREAVEKQRAKKPLKGGNTDKLQGDIYICAKCSKVVRIDDCGCFYCPDCGQRIDWSE